MCGIAGILEFGQGRAKHKPVKKMLDVMHHRGPDSSGIWSDADICLGGVLGPLKGFIGGLSPFTRNI